MYNATAQYELAPEFEALFETEYSNEYPSEREVSGVIGRDTRKRMTTTTVPPFSYICQLRMELNGTWYIGTGVKIGPRTVLTAGHNLWDEDNNKMADPAKVFVSPGRNGSKTLLGTFG